MPRFLLAALLALAACTSSEPAVEPAQAVALAGEAARDGDARRALRLLRQSAAAGDLDALHKLATTYERGYLRASSSLGEGARHLAVWTWPWSASRARRAYDRALDRAAATGDPGALLRKAERMTESVYDGERFVEPSAEVRSRARVLVDSLARAGAPAAMLHIARPLLITDRDSAAVWLTRAEAAGSARACWLRVMMIEGTYRQMWSAEDVLAAVDRTERCRTLDPSMPGDFAEDLVTNLRQSAASGPLAERAREQLDSLRALGLFERHPRLADAGRQPRASSPSHP